jgi:hypothetical protein
MVLVEQVVMISYEYIRKAVYGTRNLFILETI